MPGDPATRQVIAVANVEHAFAGFDGPGRWSRQRRGGEPTEPGEQRDDDGEHQPFDEG